MLTCIGVQMSTVGDVEILFLDGKRCMQLIEKHKLTHLLTGRAEYRIG